MLTKNLLLSLIFSLSLGLVTASHAMSGGGGGSGGGAGGSGSEGGADNDNGMQRSVGSAAVERARNDGGTHINDMTEGRGGAPAGTNAESALERIRDRN